MRKLIILVFAMVLISNPAFAICDHIYLEKISDDGSVLISNQGKVWIADSSDTAIGWDLNDDVITCNGDGILINHDQNERMSVTRVR